MLENLSFTDAQGQTFTDAVVRVHKANLNRQVNDRHTDTVNFDLNKLSEEPTKTSDTFNNENIDLNASFVYWPSEAAYLAGNQPYNLTFKVDGIYQSELYLNKQELGKDKYSSLDLEAKCELYFTDVILPTLTPGE
ncbi:hypothetical protein [Alteromonas sp. BMJM2]|uniref:hypothetical protein n=1 Tax=Alteromonas sp. BMJM2 TaxID=2954241 RepID=UPI0022B59A3B|nr:hypothetical protein [Alteromonas sp. BMJM2]